MKRLKAAFVTGAGGFIGRHLVRRLLAEDVSVVALMMPGEAIPREWDGRVRILEGDVRELGGLAPQVGEVEALFHLAAVVGDWGSRQAHVDVTVRGTEEAIELALQQDAHFVVTTSICAYGSALGRGRLCEDDPVGRPASAYEFCKQEQERLTREAVTERGLRASIVRPANVYGVGSVPWVNLVVEAMRRRRPCRMGSGRWDAGLCHVDNLVEILIACFRQGSTDGQVFNAADADGVTWREYLNRLSVAAGAPEPRSIPNGCARLLAPLLEGFGKLLKQKSRPPVTRLSVRLMGGPNAFPIEKARKLLGYQPRVGLDEAMDELAGHFQFTAEPPMERAERAGPSSVLRC